MNIHDLAVKLYIERIINDTSDKNEKRLWSTSDTPYKQYLNIDVDSHTMIDIFNRYKVIQLRKYSKEKKLLIGCGNNPITFFGYPCIEQYTGSQKKGDWVKNWSRHSHCGCFTMDKNIGMNPSIVGQLGVDDITFLPDQCFDEIILDGIVPDTKNNVNTIKMLLYLLKNGGCVSFTDDIYNRECIDYYKKVVIKIDSKLVNPDTGVSISSDGEYKLLEQMICI